MAVPGSSVISCDRVFESESLSENRYAGEIIDKSAGRRAPAHPVKPVLITSARLYLHLYLLLLTKTTVTSKQPASRNSGPADAGTVTDPGRRDGWTGGWWMGACGESGWAVGGATSWRTGGRRCARGRLGGGRTVAGIAPRWGRRPGRTLACPGRDERRASVSLRAPTPRAGLAGLRACGRLMVRAWRTAKWQADSGRDGQEVGGREAGGRCVGEGGQSGCRQG
jgi:hypothetical protein